MNTKGGGALALRREDADWQVPGIAGARAHSDFVRVDRIGPLVLSAVNEAAICAVILVCRRYSGSWCGKGRDYRTDIHFSNQLSYARSPAQ